MAIPATVMPAEGSAATSSNTPSIPATQNARPALGLSDDFHSQGIEVSVAAETLSSLPLTQPPLSPTFYRETDDDLRWYGAMMPGSARTASSHPRRPSAGLGSDAGFPPKTADLTYNVEPSWASHAALSEGTSSVPEDLAPARSLEDVFELLNRARDANREAGTLYMVEGPFRPR